MFQNAALNLLQHTWSMSGCMTETPPVTQSILPRSGDNFGSILETISPTIKSHFTNGASVYCPDFPKFNMSLPVITRARDS